tara:strand:+ start:273 stop:1052 length:780 start_codon:yes stop_codon:yes gene_type:complete
MYLTFLALTIYTYVFVFIIQSFSKYLFDLIINEKLTKYIDYLIETWIILNPNDKWIMVNNKDFETKTYEQMVYVINEGEYEDVEYEDDSDRLEVIINRMITENYSSFTLILATVLLISLSKFYSSSNLYGELIVGLLSGLSMHLFHFIYYLLRYTKDLYFDGSLELDIRIVLTATDKIKKLYLGIIPFIYLFIISSIKMYSYSRVIGEWVIDLNFLYLYFSIILGFYIIQTGIDILNASKKNPSLIFLATLYIIMGIFV